MGRHDHPQSANPLPGLTYVVRHGDSGQAFAGVQPLAGNFSMSWVRLDDSFCDHPKILAIGPIGIAIQIRALCYCARHLTDGIILREVVPSLLIGLEYWALETGGNELVGALEQATEMDWPAILVEAGVWEIVEQGYRIHDYLEYNPSRREIRKLRELKKKAGQAGGQASAQARAKHSGSEILNSPTPPLIPKNIVGVKGGDGGEPPRSAHALSEEQDRQRLEKLKGPRT